MKIRPTVFAPLVFALGVLLLAAGCDRFDTPAAQMAEVDEAGYRRGKELERQGREPEAIIEFNKLLAKRGLDNAPETNLELGILNQRRDPFAAVFHFQKYLKQRTSADRDDLVRQRIEVAKREYISTLPGRPSLDATVSASASSASAAGGDSEDFISRLQALQEDNDRLRADLKAARANNNAAGANANVSANVNSAMSTVATVAAVANTIFSSAPAAPVSPVSPVSPAQAQPARARQAQQTQAQAQAQAQQAQARQQQLQQQQLQQSRPPPQQARQAQPRAASPSRAYAIKKGDTLFGIARQFYGTASNAQIDAIVNANRGVLTAGRDTPLREGMVLKLP